jgi:hypothetical protein
MQLHAAVRILIIRDKSYILDDHRQAGLLAAFADDGEFRSLVRPAFSTRELIEPAEDVLLRPAADEQQLAVPNQSNGNSRDNFHCQISRTDYDSRSAEALPVHY